MNTWIFMMEPIYVWNRNFGSGRSHMLFKIGVLENLANFTGRHLCWSHFLIKMLCSDLQLCNFIKKRLLRRCFPLKFAKFLTKPFLQSTSGECFWNLRVLSPLYLTRSKSILLTMQNGGRIPGMVYSFEFYVKAIGIWKPVYISDKVTSSVNDVKFSNAVVSEFEWSYDTNDIGIFDFTVPWVFRVLEHHRLPLSLHFTRKILEAFVAIYWN